MRAVIKSEKHYIQWTVSPVAVGTTVNENIAHAVVILNKNQDFEVLEGASIKAIYLELWVIGQSDTASGNFLVSLYKKVGGDTQMTQAEHVALNAYDNKKNVLYHTQGISNDGVANAQPLLRGWFKIPKGKQRMGLNDVWELAISTQAEAINYCGFATYKEYT